MIRYKDLVEYTKTNHVNWDTELFSVLRDFFDKYTQQRSMITTPQHNFPPDVPPPEYFLDIVSFNPPDDGEYGVQDVLNLLNT